MLSLLTQSFYCLRLSHRTTLVDSVTRLLDETPIRMVVYSGTLDLVVPTPATVNWIDQMQWGSKKSYVDATRRPFFVDGFIEGYEKQGGNFSMFWVLRAGNLVHQDNPAAMAYILREITNFE
ncbi:uncharacterized protein LOC132798982 [Drosophila nasuta]|uniref:uncharacterized protein LOC132798982 n=1 Tax=Drosophila nasuta TaxID=42062 RepID=UPI00295E3E0D|nr:uncharacterized protein LOC132798982 [Drosophila nasuta]